MRDLLREKRGWAGGNPLVWGFLLHISVLFFVDKKETLVSR